VNGDSKTPGPNSSDEEKLIFIQANIVSFVTQYQLPIIEVALVVSKYVKILTNSLIENAEANQEVVPDSLLESKRVSDASVNPIIAEFPLESLMGMVDEDRMDILDTILRTSINKTEIAFPKVISILRDWEHITREQLAKATSPGHLFSPLEIPDGF
tara:strand:+ start:143 stop:613 length:471 start_codon:yes stop_codon:yes gene_type:complete